MNKEYTGILEIEVNVGQCQDSIDASAAVEEFIEKLKNEFPEIKHVAFLDVEEW